MMAVRVPSELAGFGLPAATHRPLLAAQVQVQRALDARLTAGRSELRPRQTIPSDKPPYIVRLAGPRGVTAKFISPQDYKRLRQRQRWEPLWEALG